MEKKKSTDVKIVVLLVVSLFIISIIVATSLIMFIFSKSPPVEIHEGAPGYVFLTITPTEINLGESANLSWVFFNFDNVTIDNGIGTVTENGSIEIFPTETTTYTIEGLTDDDSRYMSMQETIIVNN